jgi:hypothetical protein
MRSRAAVALRHGAVMTLHVVEYSQRSSYVLLWGKGCSSIAGAIGKLLRAVAFSPAAR